MAVFSDTTTIYKLMYLHRRLKNITLRQLSVMTGLSHGYLNRYEQGIVTPSHETVKRLVDALGLSPKRDEALDSMFLEVFEKLDQALFYDQREESVRLYKKLRDHHEYFINSQYFDQYYLIVLSAIQATRLDMNQLESVYKPASIIASKFSGYLKERMMFEKALNIVIKGNLQLAYEYGLAIVEKITDEHLRARVHYLIGYTIANDYKHYHEALRHFEEAKKGFEANMNYRRSNRSKSMEQILYVYLHRFEEYEQSVEETDQYCIANNDYSIYYFTSVNKARNFIIKEAYQHALDILETFTSDVFEYHFYKLYSYFRLNRNMEALREIHHLRQRPEVLVTEFESDVVNLIEHAITHAQDEVYMEWLRRLETTAHQKRDFVMIQIITRLYTEVLHARRKYKEAHYSLDRFLKVLYKIH